MDSNTSIKILFLQKLFKAETIFKDASQIVYTTNPVLYNINCIWNKAFYYTNLLALKVKRIKSAAKSTTCVIFFLLNTASCSTKRGEEGEEKDNFWFQIQKSYCLTSNTDLNSNKKK